MSSSRREFLKRGSLMALVAGIPLGVAQKTLGMGASASPSGSGLSKAAFESQLHTKFLINQEESKVAVTLVDVTSLGSKKEIRTGKEGFSLLFRGPKGATLQQNTYLIEHEKLGLFSFLVVPVRAKGNRAAHYEAVVNRLHP